MRRGKDGTEKKKNVKYLEKEKGKILGKVCGENMYRKGAD